MNLTIILKLITIVILCIMLCINLRPNRLIKGGMPWDWGKDHTRANLNKSNWNHIFCKDVMNWINCYTNNIQTEVPLTICDIKHEIPYKKHTGFIRNACHKGQRKLFLTELQALTLYPDVDYIIYVGAAPSRKSYIYHHLFPNTKFIFIDPVEFNIEVGTMNDFLNNPFRPMADATTMYDHRDTKILWLHDNYSFDPESDVYDIIAVHKEKLDRGKHMYEIYDIDKKEPRYVDRFDKDMKKWNKTIYDIENNKDLIESYRKIITDSSYRFFLIQGFYSISLSVILRKILKGKKVGFWSDIRTSIHTYFPTDIDVIWNSCQCYNWVNVLEPIYYMLKFRIPFYDMPNPKEIFKKYSKTIDEDLNYSKKHYKVDFFKNYMEKKFQWFKGCVYLQCYAPITSTECRLIGNYNKNKPSEVFNTCNHENKMFYFNNIQREFAWYNNPYATHKLLMNNDTDPMMEVKIWEEYKKINKNFDIKRGILILNKVAGTCHIRERPTWEKYKKK